MQDRILAVLGGGQLGRMLGLAAAPLGIRCRFLDPKPDASAGEIGELVVGALDDRDALWTVARGAAAVTYEWEGVPGESAEVLAKRLPVRPGAASLVAAQDRLVEKDRFSALGIPTTPYRAVDDRGGLDRALAEIGTPAILKTRRGGYDGKGQAVLREVTDADLAWGLLGDVPLVLESFVAFERELSVIATRSAAGETVVWPVTENRHENGILRLSVAPAPNLAADTDAAARDIITRLADDLDHVGTIAVELFDTPGGLLANEFAPRVHNSGHWTIDASTTSQFENHVRAVMGLPLGATEPVGYAAMVNCLGAMPDPAAVLTVSGTHLHDYRKTAAPGRKVGHLTAVAADSSRLGERTDFLIELARAAGARLEHS